MYETRLHRGGALVIHVEQNNLFRGFDGHNTLANLLFILDKMNTYGQLQRISKLKCRGRAISLPESMAIGKKSVERPPLATFNNQKKVAGSEWMRKAGDRV